MYFIAILFNYRLIVQSDMFEYRWVALDVILASLSSAFSFEEMRLELIFK